MEPLGPAEGEQYEDLSFSASGDDPDGDDVSITVDWGDGSRTTATLAPSGTTRTLSHAWTVPDVYCVKAQAEDVYGTAGPWSDCKSVTITRANQAPGRAVIVSGPTTGRTDIVLQFEATVTDPDADAVRITFDWGDGSVTVTPTVASGALVQAGHAWDEAGSYCVRAQAEDVRGGVGPWSDCHTVRINDPPFAPTLVRPADGAQGVSTEPELVWQSSGDPDGDAVTYTVYLDASSPPSTAYCEGTTETRCEGFVLLDGGTTYYWRVRVRDAYGASTDGPVWSFTTAGSPNRPPEVAWSAVAVDHDVVFEASGTRDQDGDGLTFSWDFGDGSSGSQPVTAHRYAAAGRYIVTLTVSDSKARGTVQDSRAVEVGPLGCASAFHPDFCDDPVGAICADHLEPQDPTTCVDGHPHPTGYYCSRPMVQDVPPCDMGWDPEEEICRAAEGRIDDLCVDGRLDPMHFHCSQPVADGLPPCVAGWDAVQYYCSLGVGRPYPPCNPYWDAERELCQAITGVLPSFCVGGRLDPVGFYCDSPLTSGFPPCNPGYDAVAHYCSLGIGSAYPPCNPDWTPGSTVGLGSCESGLTRLYVYIQVFDRVEVGCVPVDVSLVRCDDQFGLYRVVVTFQGNVEMPSIQTTCIGNHVWTEDCREPGSGQKVAVRVYVGGKSTGCLPYDYTKAIGDIIEQIIQNLPGPLCGPQADLKLEIVETLRKQVCQRTESV